MLREAYGEPGIGIQPESESAIPVTGADEKNPHANFGRWSVRSVFQPAALTSHFRATE